MPAGGEGGGRGRQIRASVLLSTKVLHQELQGLKIAGKQLREALGVGPLDKELKGVVESLKTVKKLTGELRRAPGLTASSMHAAFVTGRIPAGLRDPSGRFMGRVGVAAQLTAERRELQGVRFREADLARVEAESLVGRAEGIQRKKIEIEAAWREREGRRVRPDLPSKAALWTAAGRARARVPTMAEEIRQAGLGGDIRDQMERMRADFIANPQPQPEVRGARLVGRAPVPFNFGAYAAQQYLQSQARPGVRRPLPAAPYDWGRFGRQGAVFGGAIFGGLAAGQGGLPYALAGAGGLAGMAAGGAAGLIGGGGGAAGALRWARYGGYGTAAVLGGLGAAMGAATSEAPSAIQYLDVLATLRGARAMGGAAGPAEAFLRQGLGPQPGGGFGGRPFYGRMAAFGVGPMEAAQIHLRMAQQGGGLPGHPLVEEAAVTAAMLSRGGLDPGMAAPLLYAARRGGGEFTRPPMHIAWMLRERARMQGLEGPLETGALFQRFGQDVELFRQTGLRIPWSAYQPSGQRILPDPMQALRVRGELQDAAGGLAMRRFPTSFMDVMMLRHLGGLQRGPGGGVSAGQLRDALIRMRTAGPEQHRNLINALMRAGGGGAAGELLAGGLLEQHGVRVGPELMREFGLYEGPGGAAGVVNLERAMGAAMPETMGRLAVQMGEKLGIGLKTVEAAKTLNDISLVIKDSVVPALNRIADLAGAWFGNR